MTFDPNGYVLTERDGEHVWFLDTRMTVKAGGAQTGGAFIFLPHGIPHTFVVSAGPVRGLQITSPAGFEKFITEVGRPAQHLGLPEPSQPDIELLVEAGRRHGNEIVGPPLTVH